MPDRLSVWSTLFIVAFAFGLAFAIQAPLGGDSSASGSPARTSATAVVARAPAAKLDLSLANAGMVPELRDARQAKRRARALKQAPNLTSLLVPATPVKVATPAPTTTPRYVAPTPKTTPTPSSPTVQPKATPAPKSKATPAPKPKSTPAPTPDSGEFDTSGESPGTTPGSP